MAVPDTALRSRVTAPLAWVVLAGVVVGLAVGALACSAALAGGSGHLVHAQSPATALTPTPVSHDGHVTMNTGDPGEHPDPTPGGVGARSGSADSGPGGHPGMACVVTVDLGVAELVTPVAVAWFDSPDATPAGECLGDLDPPVPRSS